MTASQDIQDSFGETLNLNSPSGSSCVLKRQIEDLDAVLPPLKRTRSSAVTDSQSLCDDVSKAAVFLTAGSNREVKVSVAALRSARARLRASSEDVPEEKNDITSTEGAANKFPGFVTAGTKKVILVSETALKAAKRRLDAISDDTIQSINTTTDAENRDPARVLELGPSSSSIRVSQSATPATRQSFKQTEFVSPLLQKTPRSTCSRTESCITPVTSKVSKDRFKPPLRRASLVESPVTSGGAAPMPSRPTIGLASSAGGDLAAEKVEAQISKATPRITCIRELKSCLFHTVDFLGIVVEGARVNQSHPNSALVIKMADRYGESVSVEMLSSSIPSAISTGTVISIDGAVLKKNQDAISLTLTDSAFVDLEPNDPEAECLHRLFRTGLFDAAPSEDDFTFDSTALRVIARLNEYSSEASTVMARICSINYEALIYLGCITCKRYAVQGPDGVESCPNCNSKKARYFYSLNVEIADFSGVIAVHFSDEAAEKMIGKPAGGMVKLHKDVLRVRLSPLYYRPMLFRISQQSSRWFVDDWKYLDIPRFKPFLKNIAEQKGYK